MVSLRPLNALSWWGDGSSGKRKIIVSTNTSVMMRAVIEEQEDWGWAMGDGQLFYIDSE
jgi:hypothetical protein